MLGVLICRVSVSLRSADGPRLPNGEPKRGSPAASTLIYGRKHAVLVDPGFLAEQADAIGDCIARRSRKLTDIFITHGDGDQWFAAQRLAERFGAPTSSPSATRPRRAACSLRLASCSGLACCSGSGSPR
jgi:glyoxylase-like metal-dependent hydrolase (beta-lactamase superfamily II)